MKKMGISLLLLCLLSGCDTKEIELKKDFFTFEYGETISLEAKNYLSDPCRKEIGDKVIITLLNADHKKDFLEVGEYDAKAIYKNKWKQFKIQIKDTIKPVFTSFKTELELPVNRGIKDVLSNFLAEDRIGEKKVAAKISMEGEIDFTKEGSYEVIIIAEDENHNKASKRCKVYIKREREQIYIKEDTKIENNVVSNVEKQENEKLPSYEEEEKPVYVLPENYVDESGTHYEYFWSEAEVLERFKELRDARYHNCYFDDYETVYFELMWWE